MQESVQEKKQLTRQESMQKVAGTRKESMQEKEQGTRQESK